MFGTNGFVYPLASSNDEATADQYGSFEMKTAQKSHITIVNGGLC